MVMRMVTLPKIAMIADVMSRLAQALRVEVIETWSHFSLLIRDILQEPDNNREALMYHSLLRVAVAGFVATWMFGTPAIAQAPGENAAAAPSGEKYPVWAYSWDPNFIAPPADDVPQRLPGTAAAFSWVQARDLFFSPDWHADDHQPMPDILARGRKPDVRACGSCHRAEGTGGPENSG